MNRKIILTSSLLFLSLSASSCSYFHGKHHGDFQGKWFKEIDSNNDGFITKDEINSYSNKKFDEIDTDKNGKICKKELMEYRKVMREKKEENKEKKN